MFFLDPDRGRRRRALIRDRAVHAARVTMDAAGATSRDVAHRTSGVAARARSAFARKPVDDLVLTERVRSRLGRLVSHPQAIDVEATNGIVRLSGPVLEHEMLRVLRATEGVRGVRDVVNALDAHREAGRESALQGDASERGRWSAVWPRRWSPTRRLLVGAAATALAGYGLSRRRVAADVAR
jgi:hypothetical protein